MRGPKVAGLAGPDLFANLQAGGGVGQDGRRRGKSPAEGGDIGLRFQEEGLRSEIRLGRAEAEMSA